MLDFSRRQKCEHVTQKLCEEFLAVQRRCKLNLCKPFVLHNDSIFSYSNENASLGSINLLKKQSVTFSRNA